MVTLRRMLLWATLTLVVLLMGASVYGSIINLPRAEQFFNTTPLVVFWFVFCAALLAGIICFRRLLRMPSLLLIHAGCVAVLLGSLWGSAKGIELQNRFLKRNILHEGDLCLTKDEQDDRIRLKSNRREERTLPFALALDDFRIEYYPGTLYVRDDATEEIWSFPAEANALCDLGSPHGQLQISKVFQNCRITIAKDATGRFVSQGVDQPGAGSNPALEVRLENESRSRYVFENNPGHSDAVHGLSMRYQSAGMVRDYISDVRVMDHGRVAARKAIEVNYPLHYGGYHFYQSSWDERDDSLYTILSVVPDTGLTCVYFGYILLCGGVAWQCWFVSIARMLRQEVHPGN